MTACDHKGNSLATLIAIVSKNSSMTEERTFMSWNVLGAQTKITLDKIKQAWKTYPRQLQ